jgi:VanZ family protein
MQIALCLPGSTIPDTEGFAIPSFDKIVHVILFGALVGLWCVYLSKKTRGDREMKRAFFLVYLFAAFNGIIIEYIQRDYIPNRSFDQGDIIADVLSASIAYGICTMYLTGHVQKK